jgi:hypothetical protein
MNRGFADVLLAEDNPSDADLVLESLGSVVDSRRVHRVHDGVEASTFCPVAAATPAVARTRRCAWPCWTSSSPASTDSRFWSTSAPTRERLSFPW